MKKLISAGTAALLLLSLAFSHAGLAKSKDPVENGKLPGRTGWTDSRFVVWNT